MVFVFLASRTDMWGKQERFSKMKRWKWLKGQAWPTLQSRNASAGSWCVGLDFGRGSRSWLCKSCEAMLVGRLWSFWWDGEAWVVFLTVFVLLSSQDEMGEGFHFPCLCLTQPWGLEQRGWALFADFSQVTENKVRLLLNLNSKWLLGKW